MANIWKSKVLPKIKKVFGSSGSKKAAVAEAIKSFDETKEEISKELEEKKTELQPKVVEIYEASPAEIKTLVKKPTESGLKKNSAAVKKFLEELVKIEFPGSKPVSEVATKYGPAYVSGPVTFILDKVSGLLPAEEAAATPEATAEAESSSKEATGEVIEEIKKEEAEKVEETPPPATETPPPASAPEPEPETAPEPAKA
ncbi:DREPP plasma membrane polypeptide [Musa troglodytarum]|uniref:DREPP plasma membrane polypeptide n=2 Tax=Musa troglodytarum TaxID=320322 RepID=A0A9E7GK76_9LILI|nr:DREPP plasma membrane polypeptide [Musa troglodytarum]